MSWKFISDLIVPNFSQSDGNKFGLVMESSNADFLKAPHCELYTVGQLETRHYALAFIKGSDYLLTLFKNRWKIHSKISFLGSKLTESFSRDLLKSFESGKIQVSAFKTLNN